MLAGAEREAAVLTAMILMTLADHRVADAEVTRIRWLFGKVAGLDGSQIPSAQDVRETIDQVRAEGLELDAYLARVAPRLDVATKRRMLKAAFVVATADGRIATEEDALLVRIARALDITPESYRGMLSQMNVAREVETP